MTGREAIDHLVRAKSLTVALGSPQPLFFHGRCMGLKIQWDTTEAVVSAVITSVGVFGFLRLMPDTHPLVVCIIWLVVFAMVYQVGCEYSERRRVRNLRRKAAPE